MMPRYFFSLRDTVLLDEEGVDLGDDGQARVMAVRSLAEFLRDEPKSVLEVPELRVEVRDQARRDVLTIAVTAR